MLRRWLNRILESEPIVRILALAKRVKPWGFEGLSLYAVMRFFIEGIQKGALATRSAAITFRLFLAVFPGIILLLSIIPLIPVQDFQQNLFDNIRTFFPGDTFSLVENLLNDLIHRRHTEYFSIGFVLVLYYTSNSVNAILQGFNGSYNLERKGNPFLIRVVSLVLILVLGFLMVVAVSLIVFSSYAFDYLQEIGVISSGGLVIFLEVVRWIITILLMYVGISTLYNAGNLRRIKWSIFSAGASFATMFFIIASLGFAYFIGQFARFDELYGYLGTLLILLIWMNFNSTILLLGFELNTSISRAKGDSTHEYLTEKG
jgi:membrane protein